MLHMLLKALTHLLCISMHYSKPPESKQVRASAFGIGASGISTFSIVAFGTVAFGTFGIGTFSIIASGIGSSGIGTLSMRISQVYIVSQSAFKLHITMNMGSVGDIGQDSI